MNTDDDLFSNEELETLMGIFLDQASMILEMANQSLLRLEADAQDSEALSQIQRALHTLKGDANSVGFGEIGTIAHRLEDLLALWFNSEVSAAEIIDLLLVGMDALTDMLQRKREWVHAHLDISNIQAQIENFLIINSPTKATELPTLIGEVRLTEYQLLKAHKLISESQGNALRLDIYFDKECTMHAAGVMVLLRQIQQVSELIASFPNIEDDQALEAVDRVVLIVITEDPELTIRAARVAGVTTEIEFVPFTLDNILVASTEPSKKSQLPANKDSIQNPIKEATKEPAKESIIVNPSPHAINNTALAAEDSATSEEEVIDTRTRIRGVKESAGSTEVLRVAAGKVDSLMDLVGELVISRSMLTQICTQLKSEFPKHAQVSRLIDTESYIGRVLGELQKNVLRIRMVSLEQTFNRFFRVVRDLARENNKQIELELVGEETELDKRVVDIIYEPLLHLVRNAIDHGIEPSDMRLAAEKPTTGKISLRAYHQSDQVVIEIEDDGRGIDIERLKRRAEERGFRKKGELQSLQGMEALDLVFLNGLSTAEQVTEISGRGIGMEVVKNVIESLKGSIDISTELGKGTKFTLRLPLTLAIIRAMLFILNDSVFALPVSSIIEIARSHESEVKQIGRHKVYNLRDTLYSLIALDEILLRKPRDEQFENPFVVIIGVGERRIGLQVDKVIGEREIVVKPVDKDWIKSDLITGASILGDGRVVLILDIGALMRRAGSGLSAKNA